MTLLIIKSDMENKHKNGGRGLDKLKQFLNRIGSGSGRSRPAAPRRLEPAARSHFVLRTEQEITLFTIKKIKKSIHEK